MDARWRVALLCAAVTSTGCATAHGSLRPSTWAAPEIVVPASPFHGVHGLAVDAQGRLLAGTVVGNDMWEVDRETGAARVFIPAPEGEADDIAIGPRGELAWTSYTQGIVRYRERDDAPIRELARGLAGINSLAFDRQRRKLYASQVFYGDALWEIDVGGRARPRLIARDLGGFNGFEVGPDGMLYGPLWFKGQLVKIDPASGNLTVINNEYQTPAAANLDGQGNAWVVDTRTGELSKVALQTGKRTLFAKLKTSLDNLAIAPEGTIYVSNMADNSVQAVDPGTGEVRLLTRGHLATLLPDGSILVAELGTGSVLRMRGPHYQERSVVASGLAGPTQLALGKDGALYVVDAAGNLTRTTCRVARSGRSPAGSHCRTASHSRRGAPS